MKFEKDYIIQEIIRTAEENGGKPLGTQRFENETGIRKYDWFGKYWSKWGDALIEAGYNPNKFNESYNEEIFLGKLSYLIREIGKFPSIGEYILKKTK